MSAFISLFTTSTVLFALCGALGASIAGGIMGPFVLVKRITSLSGSIAHTVLGGMGAALYLQRVYHIAWLHPMYGAITSAFLSAILIGYIHLHYRQREDGIIAMIWSVGMAIGVLFIYHTPGTNVDLTYFLIGNPLWVTSTQIILLTLLNVLMIVVVSCFYYKLVFVCFDEVQCRLQNLPTTLLYIGLLMLIALTVVMLIYMMGVILALSMLVIPAAIAGMWTSRFAPMIYCSIGLNMVFVLLGFVLAYVWSWPLSATIVLIAGVVYTCMLVCKKWISRSIPS